MKMVTFISGDRQVEIPLAIESIHGFESAGPHTVCIFGGDGDARYRHRVCGTMQRVIAKIFRALNDGPGDVTVREIREALDSIPKTHWLNVWPKRCPDGVELATSGTCKSVQCDSDILAAIAAAKPEPNPLQESHDTMLEELKVLHRVVGDAYANATTNTSDIVATAEKLAAGKPGTEGL